MDGRTGDLLYSNTAQSTAHRAVKTENCSEFTFGKGDEQCTLVLCTLHTLTWYMLQDATLKKLKFEPSHC